MTQTENKLEIHIHEGGQLNLAMDESNINAIQNNSVQQENDIVNSFLEVINNEEYIHKIYENGKEEYISACEDDVKDFPDEIMECYKYQLGPRLNGTENNLKIICMLLREIENTLKTGKRYGVMPMFCYIPRGNRKAYVYLDDGKMPFDYVELEEYFWDAYQKYVVKNKYYQMTFILYKEKLAYIEYGYTLIFSDVTERLYGFGKVVKINNADKISFLLNDINKKIDIDMNMLGDEREQQIELTKYWVEQMEMIDTIEKFYDIKFYLPKKAKEKDYDAIETIYNAINKKQTCIFPAMPLEKELFRKSIKMDEILINDGKNFQPLELFGYKFIPHAAYLMKCTLIWKKKIRAWETSEGGVPVRIEFSCYKA